MRENDAIYLFVDEMRSRILSCETNRVFYKDSQNPVKNSVRQKKHENNFL